MKAFLETERLYLVSFEESDAHLIKNLDSDPDVVRFISNGIPSDDNEVKRAMGIFISYNQKYNQQLGFWKAINKKTNEFMGWFHLRPLKANLEDLSNLELGYRLLKKFWGQGIATEGSRALVEVAKKRETAAVWAHAMLANDASINVMKKSGLTFDRNDTYEQWPGDDKRCVWYKLSLK